MVPSDHMVIGLPVKVHWAGWETNTARLASAGWQMTVSRGFYAEEMEMFLKHPAGLYGMAVCNGRLWQHALDRNSGLPPPEFVMKNMGCSMHVVAYSTPRMFADGFYQISGSPSMINTSEIDIGKLPGFFTPAKPQVQEIIIEPQSVQECFDLIKKLQAPDLAKIRERNRRAEPVIQAQILSFG